MKILLLLLALAPTLSFAMTDAERERAADRASDSLDRAHDRMERMDEMQRERHGVGFVCVARDAQNRTFQSPWLAGDLDSAKRSALGRCGFFWNKGCRLLKCGQQRF